MIVGSSFLLFLGFFLTFDVSAGFWKLVLRPDGVRQLVRVAYKGVPLRFKRGFSSTKEPLGSMLVMMPEKNNSLLCPELSSDDQVASYDLDRERQMAVDCIDAQIEQQREVARISERIGSVYEKYPLTIGFLLDHRKALRHKHSDHPTVASVIQRLLDFPGEKSYEVEILLEADLINFDGSLPDGVAEALDSINFGEPVFEY